MQARDCPYEALEPKFPLSRDPEFVGWNNRLGTLSPSKVSIREATAIAEDGRRMKDLQVLCPPISVRPVKENVTKIAELRVLIADVDGIHVGFCVSSPGFYDSDPLFIQVVAVVPAAQRRGVGLALLTTAAEREPQRDIALATQNDNAAARSMNEQFAKSIDASIRRIKLSTYRDCDFGIQRGLGYRAWVIKRQPLES